MVANDTDYAVAWWAFDGPLGPLFSGDFDGDGMIGMEDYDAWSASYGLAVVPGTGADGNRDGVIDAADYTLWRDAFAAATTAVPEPSSLLILVAAILIAPVHRRI